ncbi:hypothetical protein DEO72_LG5g1370 [Vigna unguiculata]|uniref:GRF-type domain-containing protein n=1 Tax=Vigna unguiculata TaxID=3917 RepID=A0A4D6LX89_VIGUN|nr:hypothetical protein DEO72_LG5g1370 [Vigna unguiculata]
MKNSTVSSHGGVGRRFDFAPLCYCGEKAIMRTGRTAKNRGRKFWGCPKFKVEVKKLLAATFFHEPVCVEWADGAVGAVCYDGAD